MHLNAINCTHNSGGVQLTRPVMKSDWKMDGVVKFSSLKPWNEWFIYYTMHKLLFSVNDAVLNSTQHKHILKEAAWLHSIIYT